MNGHTVAGFAVDLDVSGSVDPFDTPQLGEWLKNRAPEFDVIACWKLDRLSRNSIKLNKLFGWCIEHDKTVVSTSESIDLGTPVGRLIANVIAFLAEGELEQIRDRQLSSRRKLRETARWPGGRPPYGYRAVDNRSGAGKVLEIDPEAYAVVRRIVDAVIDGVPLIRIARELNDEGVLPPATHYWVSVGNHGPTLGVWKAGPIKRLLLAPTLVGHAHLGGVAVRDDHGQPVKMAEPLVSDDERDLIAAELERVQAGPRERRESGPLAGIVLCWFCGSQLSQTRHTKGVQYRYYRCHVNSCGPMIPAADAETLAEETFLHDYGDREVTERVWIRGDTKEAELRTAVSAFDELSATAGVLTSKMAKDRLQRQLTALDARIAELEATPAREGHWEHQPTGEKYSDVWERHADDPEARRELLKRSGILIRIGISGVGKRSRNNGGAWHLDITSPVPFDEDRAREERRRYGVPGD
jgi:site-specific DNA recombinase